MLRPGICGWGVDLLRHEGVKLLLETFTPLWPSIAPKPARG